MKHDWKILVNHGPTRVHWCAECGRVVVNLMERGEEGDWEYQVESIKRQPKRSDCLRDSSERPSVPPAPAYECPDPR